jgi:hypothetical protein
VSQASGSQNSPLNGRGEWRTIAVIVAVYGLTVLTVLRHEVLTPWLTIPFLSVLGAWHLSMQHETIHGHPFRRRWINDAIGSIPVTLWIPYYCFKKDHLEHHESDLTPVLTTKAITCRQKHGSVLENFARLRTGPTVQFCSACLCGQS